MVGILRLAATVAEPTRRRIQYVTGDALDARGDGARAIVHVVNDRTPNWGGGFARALRDRYPDAQTDFRERVRRDRRNLRLGAVRSVRLDPTLKVVTLVAQKGYGPSDRPRIRYDSLRTTLHRLSKELVHEAATVHMPRIGAGMARGDWNVIAELIQDELVDRGHEVIVYSLPGESWQSTQPVASQHTLSLQF